VNAVAPGPIDTERTGTNTVLFLASPEASYITGHTLPVTGGR
jgi:NAD(P)-dependent dehydrogenase (short-subunit alcohol dehydrogenase family)